MGGGWGEGGEGGGVGGGGELMILFSVNIVSTVERHVRHCSCPYLGTHRVP